MTQFFGKPSVHQVPPLLGFSPRESAMRLMHGGRQWSLLDPDNPALASIDLPPARSEPLRDITAGVMILKIILHVGRPTSTWPAGQPAADGKDFAEQRYALL